ncbi:thioredoxin family protein [Microbacterium sp. SCN 69-37]|uniref:thioredoxin family protein n=1 Tax=Microbacterium sp. SCN 69-37 TaxID=1660115 RepID=UPI00342AA331
MRGKSEPVPHHRRTRAGEGHRRTRAGVTGFLAGQLCPCRALEPRLDRFASANPGAFEGYRIDVDAQPDIVKRYSVMSIPTIIVLRNGRETARLDGLIRDSDLAELLGWS